MQRDVEHRGVIVECLLGAIAMVNVLMRKRGGASGNSLSSNQSLAWQLFPTHPTTGSEDPLVAPGCDTEPRPYGHGMNMVYLLAEPIPLKCKGNSCW